MLASWGGAAVVVASAPGTEPSDPSRHRPAKNFAARRRGHRHPRARPPRVSAQQRGEVGRGALATKVRRGVLGRQRAGEQVTLAGGAAVAQQALLLVLVLDPLAVHLHAERLPE